MLFLYIALQKLCNNGVHGWSSSKDSEEEVHLPSEKVYLRVHFFAAGLQSEDQVW